MAGERLLRSSAQSATGSLRETLIKTAGLVGNGMLLSKSGYHTGVFSPRDRRLIEVGEGGG